METEHKIATDWLTATGAGLLAEGNKVSEYIKRLCPFFYEIEYIMCDGASICPLALSEEIDFSAPDEAVEFIDTDNDSTTRYVKFAE
jgi:hypothetical protein